MKKLFFVLCACVLALSFNACDSKGQLKAAVALAAAQCPMDQDGIVVTDIFIEDNSVVYNCVIPEDEDFTVELFDDEYIQSAMKDQMLASFIETQGSEEFAKLCKESNCSVVYRYVGAQTNHTVNITLYPDEF